MKVELDLTYPGKFRWSKHENIYFIGYAFDETGKLYQEAADWEEDILLNKIETVLGAFAAVLLQKDQVIVWCDTGASFPIFYKKGDNKLIISSQPHPDINDEIIDREAYKRIFCTEGKNTLLPNWSSILVGHKLVANLHTQQVQVKRYFDHFVLDKVKNDDNFERQFLRITQEWAQQIITYANGKQIWVALSGGYDCRLILSTLIMAKAPNLHCYTYGRKESQEIQMASEVARVLNLKWHFIPYDEQTFGEFFTDSWMNYAMQNHHYHTLPHEQDFFALTELSKKGLLEEGFIGIAGHVGEIPAGSVMKSYPIQLKEYITQTCGFAPQHYMKDKDIDTWDRYHQWINENKMSKFITNSIRLFEYFGGKWMLPMWHRDFMHLFYSLEFSERWDKKAYVDLSFKHYFKPLNIDFVKPKNDTRSSKKSYKEYIKAILPNKILRKIKYINSKSIVVDPCNLHVLYEMLYEHMHKNKIPLPEKDGDLNRLHAFYMLHLLKEQLQ